MFSIKECRQKLGKFGENKTDKEIESVRDMLYKLCNIVIDEVISKKSIR